MNEEEQRRFRVFCVIVAVSCIYSLAYAYMIYNAIGSAGNGKVYDGEFMVDGEDFAPAIRIGEIIVKTIADGIRAVILLVIGAFWAVIGNVLAFIYLYTRTLKESLYISKKEISLTRRVIWGSLIAELILAFILIQRESLWIALLLFWQMPLFANLPYLWKMKARYKKINQH